MHQLDACDVHLCKKLNSSRFETLAPSSRGGLRKVLACGPPELDAEPEPRSLCWRLAESTKCLSSLLLLLRKVPAGGSPSPYILSLLLNRSTNPTFPRIGNLVYTTMCTYTYTYIYMYIHTHVFTYLYIDIYRCIDVDVCCMEIYAVRIHLHVCIYI